MNTLYPIHQLTESRACEEAYRLRYQIAVQEMGRFHRYADHKGGRLKEPADDTAKLYGVYCENAAELVGTARLNFSKTAVLEDDPLYDWRRFERLYPGRVVLGSKLMLKKEYRRRCLFLSFVQFLFRRVLVEGTDITLMNCNESLVPLFSRLGFRSYKGHVFHFEYGKAYPMILFHHDVVHFQRMRSPLLEVYDDFYSSSMKVNEVES